MICDRCKQDKDNVSVEPSRSQLMFGGFPVKYEKRCEDCEKELIRQINKVLKNER